MKLLNISVGIAVIAFSVTVTLYLKTDRTIKTT